VKMDNLLIHRCTLKTRTQDGTDDFGNPVWAWAEQQNIKCLFITPKGTSLDLTSGEYVTRLPRLILKKALTEADEVEGTSGFIGNYTISKVYHSYDGNKLHHYAADLARRAGD